jgi:hypothetical protein
MTRHARGKRLPFVGHECGIAGVYLARIPEIPLVFLKAFRAGCDQYPVGALLTAARAGGQDPAQPRFQNINPQRIREVFATQSFDEKNALAE